jgi:quercetin dioxygenase-like cupin family protein
VKPELGPVVVRPGEGESVWLGGLGVHFKLRGADTGGLLAVVEHPIEPGRLVPPHVHQHEHELSYVLHGTIGARVGDAVVDAPAGSYVLKPKGIPHTFWNATGEVARLIEMIFPAGFDGFFEAVAAGEPDDVAARRPRLAEEYGLGYVPEWIEELKTSYGLRLIGE